MPASRRPLRSSPALTIALTIVLTLAPAAALGPPRRSPPGVASDRGHYSSPSSL